MSSSVTSKFKKGDKVLRTGSTGGYYIIQQGGVYVVHEYNHLTNDLYLEGVYLSNGELDWFNADNFELIEEPKSYRNMKPTDLITISIGGNQSEVPLGDLVHATALLGVTNGWYGARIWEALNKSLGKDGFTEDLETVIEFRDKQKETLDYFFKPYYDKQQQEKEDLMKDIELQKEVLDNQKKLLKSLEDKLSQM